MNQHTNPRPTFGDETQVIRLLSVSELRKECDELDAWYDQMIVHDQANKTLTLYFECPYEIDLNRIKTSGHLLRWLVHLLEKPWLTCQDIQFVASKIAEIKHIKIYD
jgi:hypothetical protein